jgi:hypothetical protein
MTCALKGISEEEAMQDAEELVAEVLGAVGLSASSLQLCEISPLPEPVRSLADLVVFPSME